MSKQQKNSTTPIGTVENTHGKICDKIQNIKQAVAELHEIVTSLSTQRPTSQQHMEPPRRRRGRGRATVAVSATDDPAAPDTIARVLQSIQTGLLLNDAEKLETTYNLSVVETLNDYYEYPEREADVTKEYYRIIVRENIVPGLDTLAQTIEYAATRLAETLVEHPGAVKKSTMSRLDAIIKRAEYAQNIEITVAVQRRNYDICKCGSRMNTIPELSELHCTNPDCGLIKYIVGMVFRDENQSSQECTKPKRSGYDASRHYNFWITRLQALETVEFPQEVLAKIEYVIQMNKYDRMSLTCSDMRAILKNPLVKATSYNDHVPLLVKTFGGRPPPQLTFQENRAMSAKFNTIMRLYTKANPNGGNRPYYPYFIYKIVEQMFKHNPEKLRLLDYIHLQSRETIMKNDRLYKKICELASPEDDLEFIPTDPAGRI